jgi:Ca-activated chloride channel family protein
MLVRGIWLAVVCVVVGACGKSEETPPQQQGSATPGLSKKEPTPAPGGALDLVVAYGSEKKTWLEEQARKFEATGAKTKSGRAIRVKGVAMGSGEVTQAILAGKLQPAVFSPASGVYIALLNQQWQSLNTGGANHTKPLSPAGEPLVLSPIVIAMWRPMAEALGWPDRKLSWSDLLKVNADPKGWGAFGHPEWGRFKLGHTHPEYSNSGVLAVLAEAYAGAGKTRGLTVDDLRNKKTRDFVASVESTLVHYGKSTGFFADTMVARGPEAISAAVLYENLVIESYSKSPAAPIVAIYPVEGTFWSDHPYAILDADWVTADDRDAAAQFLAFLKAKPAQQRALELGFRPGDPSIATTAPIDAAHGVDPKQPSTLLDIPDAATLAELLELWRQTKKTADVILVFDKSGSMDGEPMRRAQAGAHAFLDTLHASDDVTLIFFDSDIRSPYGPYHLGEKKAALVRLIDDTRAGGGTLLYDAIAEAYDQAAKRAAKEPGRIHAVVVMTDGQDDGSRRYDLKRLQKHFDAAGDVRVFTIAYGAAADTKVLAAIAEAARGASENGGTDKIVELFADMGSFF